jgi:hypothetical protein
MSNQVIEATGLINQELEKLYEVGNPAHITVEGYPRFRVISFDPLITESYGRIINRPPHIAGRFILRSIFNRQYENGAFRLYYGLQTGREGYGAPIHDIRVLNQACQVLGLSKLEFYYTG